MPRTLTFVFVRQPFIATNVLTFLCCLICRRTTTHSSSAFDTISMVLREFRSGSTNLLPDWPLVDNNMECARQPEITVNIETALPRRTSNLSIKRRRSASDTRKEEVINIDVSSLLTDVRLEYVQVHESSCALQHLSGYFE